MTNRDNRFCIWNSMRGRCYRPCTSGYKYYGGRGIKVCDRWNILGGEGFKNFCEDMGLRPSMKHTLDRIDNQKDYSKENCQWLLWNENCVKRNLLRNFNERPGGRTTIRRVLLSVGVRLCSKCKELKWVEDFVKNKNIGGGYSSICKSCSRLYFKNYCLSHERNRSTAHLTVA